MKAVVVHAARDLRVEERPVPDPGEGEVRVRMTHGGICGSDLHYYLDGRVGSFVLQGPLVLGHEVVGTVDLDPSGRHAPGTKVAIHPAYADHRCPECLAGHPNTCRNARYLGSAASDPQTQGGFAEHTVVRLDQLRPLPQGLELDRAVLAEPLGVALHALDRAGDVRGRRVLVTGAGPIGALVVAAAAARGAAEVTATDLQDKALEVAHLVGATRTVRVDREPVPELAHDVAVEASGSPRGLSTAIASVVRGGTVVQVGSLPGGDLSVALGALVSREITLRGAFRFTDEIDEALHLLATDDRFGHVVTHTFPLADVARAMDVALDPGRSSKVVLELS
ncbi:L-idonate 5-dehydrogenase [Lapillicoccus jejuensis]|uniref:L-idonate 5-dehydrogenase n=1 Tax=Lapillicoccus jejuensis TaxID=402171 RepID=A0A542E1X5_9MICO|nr:L-idonate 5-dehydrogenase [Lapillicoccus jejuensis]TQJ09224.1 L-idonate 5-dehydrogenase [Lapillicoccus jejuensis]